MSGRRTLRDRLRQLQSHSARLAAAVLVVLAVAGLAVAAGAWRTCGFGGCPDVSLLAEQPARAELPAVPLHTLPTRVVQAFLALEDKRFQEHNGVDWQRVGGALLANLRAGSFAQGFSTITMRLACHLLPAEGAERGAARNLLEMRVAREIEARYSKDEILELYLNRIDFGNGARGIDAAARRYFDRPASQLTLPQAALLAALAKAPDRYDPHRHPEAARRRRDLVLALLVQQGRVSYKEADAALALPLEVAPAAFEEREAEPPSGRTDRLAAGPAEPAPAAPGVPLRSVRVAERRALEPAGRAGEDVTSGDDRRTLRAAVLAFGEAQPEPVDDEDPAAGEMERAPDAGRPAVQEAGRGGAAEGPGPGAAPTVDVVEVETEGEGADVRPPSA